MCDESLSQFDDNLMDGLEFCSKVYELFESIIISPEGPSRFRKRRRSDKKLLEELLPICRYVQANYRPGRYISVKWINGSQQFDAELFQRGPYVGENGYPATAFLEVTCSMHPNEYLIRELLDTKGEAFGVDGVRRLKNGEIESTPISYTNREFVETDANLIKDLITKKANIPYPENTTLIVDCTLSMPYFPDEWADLMNRVQTTLPSTQFHEIYLYDHAGQYSLSIYPQNKV